MEKILVVVDMQNDFLTGSLANPDAIEIIPKIKNLIKSKEYSRIIFTQDTHYHDYLKTPEGKALPIEHCLLGEEGWKISAEFDEFIKDTTIPVSFLHKSTFGTLQLSEYLKNFGQFNEVTFCGTCTDICVVSNALILKTMSPELIINVKEDCCVGVTPEKHKAAISVMESCQINII